MHLRVGLFEKEGSLGEVRLSFMRRVNCKIAIVGFVPSVRPWGLDVTFGLISSLTGNRMDMISI